MPTIYSQVIAGSNTGVSDVSPGAYAESTPVAFAGDQSENMINLMGIGDSRTFQCQDNSLWPYSYRFNIGYVNHALSFLGERFRWKKEFNLGVSGATASGFDATKTTTVQSVLVSRPTTERWDAVWWIGGNDAIADITASAYGLSFRSVMKYLMNSGIENVYVMGEIPYPRGYNGESAAQHTARIALLKAYNAELQDYCSKFTNLHYIDNYVSYGKEQDHDASIFEYSGTDIHPGSKGSLLLGKNLADKMLAVRGKFIDAPGVAISLNPTLYDIETITDVGAVGNFYCSQKSSGVTTTRATDNEGLVVTLDARGAAAKTFNIFSDTTSWFAGVMPGDVLVACLDVEVLEAEGLTFPPYAQIKEKSGGANNFAAANWNPASYAKGTIAGLGRQLYLSDPHLITAGKAVTTATMQPYLFSHAPAGTYIKYKVYEVSCRRIYTTTNAEYSAAATIPLIRRNIKCLTSTAGAGFTLTLPPLYNVPDGTVVRFQDYEGNASVNNVTIAGNAAELIKDGASSGNTVVLSTNYFNKAYRSDRGAGGWLAI